MQPSQRNETYGFFPLTYSSLSRTYRRGGPSFFWERVFRLRGCADAVHWAYLSRDLAQKIASYNAHYQTIKPCYPAPMQVILSPHGEQLLKDQLARNAGSSPEEILERALEKLAEQEPTARKKTRAEAVAHIRESRKGVTLGGLKIKDLTHEGHKY